MAPKTRKPKKVVEEPINLDSLRKNLWMDSIPANLPFREEELDKIEEFCRDFVDRRGESQSLYLGGVPGTGKTSCVVQTIKKLEEEDELDFVFIHLNGGEMVKPEDLYVQFYQKYKKSKARISTTSARQQLLSIFNYGDAKRSPVILLLDELDFLVNRNQSVIYDVFNLASLPESRLAIISITNTFDFTSRVLDQRIQSRLGTNRVHFQPYDFKQIEQILIARLEKFESLVEKSAIMLASRRVANMSGDIRKALDVLRRAIDIAVVGGRETLKMSDIDEACKESKSTYRMCLVRSMSSHELRFLRALYEDLFHSSLEEVPFGYVYRHYERLCADQTIEPLNIDEVLRFAEDGAGIGFYNLSKAPGSFGRKISLGFAMFEAKFCLDKVEEEMDDNSMTPEDKARLIQNDEEFAAMLQKQFDEEALDLNGRISPDLIAHPASPIEERLSSIINDQLDPEFGEQLSAQLLKHINKSTTTSATQTTRFFENGTSNINGLNVNLADQPSTSSTSLSDEQLSEEYARRLQQEFDNESRLMSTSNIDEKWNPISEWRIDEHDENLRRALEASLVDQASSSKNSHRPKTPTNSWNEDEPILSSRIPIMGDEDIELSRNEFLKYDEMFKLTVPASYFKAVEKSEKGLKKKKKESSSNRLEKLLMTQLKGLAENLLEKSRVASLVVRRYSNPDEDPEAERYFFLGLIFGDRWAEPIMRGPPANTFEGKKFRTDFGEMSEIRKFADNALCESVCWVEMDENNLPCDTSDTSIGEKYMNFVCYKKLSLPKGALKQLFIWPKNWFSVVPRSLLPPLFLQNSYNELAKRLRSISLMSLAIVGVNCVSGHYRDTEPFRLSPVRELWRRFKKGHCNQRLNASGKLPFVTPSVKVFITLEQTGKWGKDIEKIKAYKTACYVELASEFLTNQNTNAIAKEDSALILLNGVVFQLMIIHDYELRQYQALTAEFSTDALAHQETAGAHEATVCQQLQSVSLRFSAFGEACQLAKRWLASSYFSGHFNELAIELLVAKGFIESVGRSVDGLSPMTVTSGFLQFLNLLATHNFLEEPIFVDINDGLSEEDKEQITQEFLKRRPVLPCICISTPEDRSGTRYTTACPEPIVMCRLVKIAQKAMNSIIGSLHQQVPVNYGQICVDDNSVYDFVIELKPEKTQAIGGNRAIAIPIVDFDSSTRLVEEYRNHLGKYAIFFYDKYRAAKIAVLYRKNFRLPSKKELVECAKHFECEPDSIKLQAEFKEQIAKLGDGMLLSTKSGNSRENDSD
ncbi:Origin recognition complex subunit 1 [Aphelenchoides bicaudatus]|nr:Origin recognition complex subunit 1 [Aphelenchoides bicaudatus]